MLGSFAAAGLWITEYPDNSIVCHANRITGGSQDVFVSGAALAVDTAADIGFFPNVYNEDWLFFFDYAAEKRLANSGHEVTQLQYDPFAKPRRAAWQEFGDVLAEGLYTLLHLGMAVDEATTDYWHHFLEARRSFLEGIATRAESAQLKSPDQVVHRGQLVYSVKRAQKCLQTIDADLCARYVQAWRGDLDDWRQRVAGIGQLSTAEAPVSTEEALAALRLAPNVRMRHMAGSLSRWDEAVLAPAPGVAAIPRSPAMNHMPERAGAGGLTTPTRA
jgi:hypothetical protein